MVRALGIFYFVRSEVEYVNFGAVCQLLTVKGIQTSFCIEGWTKFDLEGLFRRRFAVIYKLSFYKRWLCG